MSQSVVRATTAELSVNCELLSGCLPSGRQRLVGTGCFVVSMVNLRLDEVTGKGLWGKTTTQSGFHADEDIAARL